MFTKQKRKRKHFPIFLLLLALVTALLTGCPQIQEQLPPQVGQVAEQIRSIPARLDKLAEDVDRLSIEMKNLARRISGWLDSLTQPPPPEVPDASTFAVHFVDVGQADGMLLEALETAPDSRGKGNAFALIRDMVSHYPGKIYSHIHKRNHTDGGNKEHSRSANHKHHADKPAVLAPQL